MLHHVSVEHVHEGDCPHTGPRFLVVFDHTETALLAGTHGSSKLVNVLLDVTQADAGTNEQDHIKRVVEGPFLESAHDLPDHLFVACVDFFKGASTGSQEKLGLLTEDVSQGLVLADTWPGVLVRHRFLLGGGLTTFLLLGFFFLNGVSAMIFVALGDHKNLGLSF